MIQSERLQDLNDAPPRPSGRYVLYWMQASARTDTNHALEYAVGLANDLKLPLAVVFGLMDDYPEANVRHYAFLLQGLADVSQRLAARGIPLAVQRGHPAEVAAAAAQEAAAVVCDRGYLRHQRQWRERVANASGCRVMQLESDVVVPVQTASGKAEYAARTIRPKITRLLPTYLKALPAQTLVRGGEVPLQGQVDLTDVEGVLASLKLDRSLPISPRFVGGETEGLRRLSEFVKTRLAGYEPNRNEPSLAATSTMSPYLNFGHLSPLRIAMSVIAAARKANDPAMTASAEAYVEELVVRRELSMNHVFYRTDYDRYDVLPEWARKTLAEHRNDTRSHLYTPAQLEAAETHDPYWNAAQIEMNRTGFMHNYMRMYWGKKILEWSPSPQEAFATTLRLNNRGFIDGRGPLGFANVAWVYGLHDRPWGPARPIFGLIRYMNAAGLKRKFDMDGYVKWVAGL